MESCEYDENEMVHLENFVFLSENESRYIDLVMALVSVVEEKNPMSAASISHLMEMTALPSQETASAISTKLVNKFRPRRYLSTTDIRIFGYDVDYID